MEYQIIKKDSFYVLVKARSFHMDNHLGLIPEFWDECNQDDTFRILCKNGINPEILGICEPEKKGQKTFRYGIGIECAEDTVAPEGYEVWKLAAHTWAVFRCVGPMPKAIQELNHRIYTEFFPQSEYEPISDIDFERYPGENSKADYSAEVWIPVRKKTN